MLNEYFFCLFIIIYNYYHYYYDIVIIIFIAIVAFWFWFFETIISTMHRLFFCVFYKSCIIF